MVDAVLAHRRGHPYATQELCYFLWGGDAGGRGLDQERFEAALADVLRSENAHFDLIWEKASKLSGWCSRPGARAGPALSGAYRSRHRLPGPSSVQRALEALSRNFELIVREADHRIAEPFLADWLLTR